MIIWFILFGIFTIIEVTSVALVSIWFAIGALAALLVSLFTDNLVVQSVVFVLVSFSSLIATRPFLNKYHNNKVVHTNLDMVIGKEAIVTEEITEDNLGEVKVDGKRWSAAIEKSSNVNTFPIGSKVSIVAIDGVKLLIKEVM